MKAIKLITTWVILLIVFLSSILALNFAFDLSEKHLQDRENEKCESADEYSLYGYSWNEFPITYNYENNTPDIVIKSMERAIRIYDDLFDENLFLYNDNNINNPKLIIKYSVLKTNEFEQELGRANVNMTEIDGMNFVQQANITFNSEAYFVESSFSCEIIEYIDEGVDINSVALHELGHVLGLDHVSNEFSTMYYIMIGSFQQTLTEGEIAGLKILYNGIVQ